MKNRSWKYPFERIGDKRFDKNHDGELDLLETLQRDEAIERDKKISEDFQKKLAKHTPRNSSSRISNHLDGRNSVWLFLSVIILIAGVILCMCLDVHNLWKAAIIFLSVGGALLMLKLSRYIKK